MYGTHTSDSIIQTGWKMSAIRGFTVTKENIALLSPAINQEIDALSNQFKRIYITSSGFTTDGAGEIVIQLRVSEPI